MATRKTIAPARLYVILARDTSSAVILRHGPSEWVQVIRWNTATDTFEPGHWFKGNLYRERCDLSPSGDRFIYYATKYGRRYVAPTYTNAWTAVSRVPYLTAIALWTNRGDTFYGGGLFNDEETIWLNSIDAVNFDAHNLTPHPDHQLPDSVTVVPNPLAIPLESIEDIRLLRDGWTWREDGRTPIFQALWRAETPPRSLPGDLYRRGGILGWVLHLRLPVYDPENRWDNQRAYSLLRPEFANRLPETLEGAEWADWDQQGRLVCARAGKLFQITPPERREELVWREIADFNDAKPLRFPPPDWATRW